MDMYIICYKFGYCVYGIGFDIRYGIVGNC